MRELKVSAMSFGRQYVIANLDLIVALQNFFQIDDDKEKLDFSYYSNIARAQAFELMNQGAEYINKTSYKEKEENKGDEGMVYQRLYLEIDILTPVIFVPENISGDSNNEVLILNMGRIETKSNLIEYDPNISYSQISDHASLFDVHKIQFVGMNLLMIKHLDNYLNWETAKLRVNILKEIHFIFQLEVCVEPDHEDFPGVIMFCNIDEIQVYFSDYIMINLLQMQDYIMTTLSGKEFKGVDVTDSNTSSQNEREEISDLTLNQISERRDYDEYSGSNELSQSDSSPRKPLDMSDVNITYTPRDSNDQMKKEKTYRPFQRINSEEMKEGGSSESHSQSDESDYNEESKLTLREDSNIVSEEYSSVQNTDTPVDATYSSYPEGETPVEETYSSYQEGETPVEADNHSNTEENSSNASPMMSEFRTLTNIATDLSKNSKFSSQNDITEGSYHNSTYEEADLSDPDYPSHLEYESLPANKIKNNATNPKSTIELGKELNHRLYSCDNRIEKVNMKILIAFQLFSITLGETYVDKNKKATYNQSKARICKINLENLVFEMNAGKEKMNINVTMDKIEMQDLQKNKETNEPLIPSPYNFIF